MATALRERNRHVADHNISLREFRRDLYKSPIDDEYFRLARTGELEATKAPERTKVVRFLLDNLSATCPRFLTNPGPRWLFEREVECEIGEYRSHFVGIERSWPVLEFGLRHMPGRHKVELRLTSRGEELHGFQSPKCCVLHMNNETAPRQLAQHDKVNLNVFKSQYRHRRFNRGNSGCHFRSFSAVWLDIFGPLGTHGMCAMLRTLPDICFSKKTPMAFTFLCGRDKVRLPRVPGCGGLCSRAIAISRELEASGRKFEIEDAWTYSGMNGANMATVCGVLHRRIRPE